MIEFEGNITAALLARAGKTHGSRIYLFGGLVLLIAGIIGFLMQPAPLDPARHGLVALVAIVGGALVTRALAKPKEIPEVRVTGSISEQRLSIITPKSEEHLQWSSFSGAFFGEDYVILQQSPFFTIILGREFFRDAASWDEVRAIVTRHVRIVPQMTPAKTAMSLLLWLGLFALAMLVAYYFNRPG